MVYKGEAQMMFLFSLEETRLSRVDPVAVFSCHLMVTEETEQNRRQQP